MRRGRGDHHVAPHATFLRGTYFLVGLKLQLQHNLSNNMMRFAFFEHHLLRRYKSVNTHPQNKKRSFTLTAVTSVTFAMQTVRCLNASQGRHRELDPSSSQRRVPFRSQTAKKATPALYLISSRITHFIYVLPCPSASKKLACLLSFVAHAHTCGLLFSCEKSTRRWIMFGGMDIYDLATAAAKEASREPAVERSGAPAGSSSLSKMAAAHANLRRAVTFSQSDKSVPSLSAFTAQAGTVNTVTEEENVAESPADVAAASFKRLHDRRISVASSVGSMCQQHNGASRRPSSASAAGQSTRANTVGEFASSRWRIFGSVTRPTPEWRRRATASMSELGAVSGVTTHDDTTVSPCASPRSDVEETPAAEHHGASNAPSPLNFGRAMSEASFNLGRNYASGVLARRGSNVAATGAAGGSRAPRHSSGSSRVSAGRGSFTSTSSPRRSNAVANALGLTEAEVEKLVERRSAQKELAVVERYERELLDMAEREAAAVVAMSLAQHERDAAREVARQKRKRIAELEALVGSLAERFLFTNQRATDAGAKREPIPLMVDGKVPHPAIRPNAPPADLAENTADHRLFLRLRDAIAAFERNAQPPK
jgi:hypothetical protein